MFSLTNSLMTYQQQLYDLVIVCSLSFDRIPHILYLFNNVNYIVHIVKQVENYKTKSDINWAVNIKSDINRAVNIKSDIKT